MSARWVTLAGALVAVFVPVAAAQNQAEPLSGLLVEVTRGSIVESRHYGRLVVVTPEGQIRVKIGDPQELIFPRSSLKPLQALATIQMAQAQGIQLSSEEIAIMCASHEGHDYHVQAVKLLLAQSGAREENLYCGPVGGSRISNGCSGKHGGMLLQCKLSGAPMEGYWEVDHPVQQRIQQTICEFTGYDKPLESGPDGCGVPNYALPLYHMALGFARLANPDAAPEKYRQAARAIRDAMQAHPELISSRDSFDAKLMAAGTSNVLCKNGAEACYGMGLTEPGLGVAIKIEDGNPRGMPCAVVYALEQLGAMTPKMEQAVGDRRSIEQINSVGVVAGQIRPVIWSATPTAQQSTPQR